MHASDTIPIEPEKIDTARPESSLPLSEESRRGWLSWLCANVILPLTPALVGASIRFIHRSEFTFNVFDPAEVAFSLAMFCLLGAVSANEIKGNAERDTVFTAFTIGVAFFMAMFALSVFLSSELTYSNEIAIEGLTASVNGQLSDSAKSDVSVISRTQNRARIDATISLILKVVGLVGFVFVGLALVFRDKYRLGES